jgi:hypothetical protein
MAMALSCRANACIGILSHSSGSENPATMPPAAKENR